MWTQALPSTLRRSCQPRDLWSLLRAQDPRLTSLPRQNGCSHPGRTNCAAESGDQARGPLTTAWHSLLPSQTLAGLWVGQAASFESLARESQGGEGRFGLEGRVSHQKEASTPIAVGMLAGKPMPRLPGAKGHKPWEPLPLEPPRPCGCFPLPGLCVLTHFLDIHKSPAWLRAAILWGPPCPYAEGLWDRRPRPGRQPVDHQRNNVSPGVMAPARIGHRTGCCEHDCPASGPAQKKISILGFL